MAITIHFNRPVSGAFTGSFLGDGAGVTGVVSSSYSVTASYATVAQSVLGAITSSSFATTSSYAGTASLVDWTGVANRPTGLVSSSTQLSGSQIQAFITGTLTGSLIGSASFATNALLASRSFSSDAAISSVSSSFATSGLLASRSFVADTAISGAFATNALLASRSFSADAALTSISSSFASSTLLASRSFVADTAISGAYALTSSFARSGSHSVTSSWSSVAAVAPQNIRLTSYFGADIVLTEIPQAAFEWDDGARMTIDLTGYREARLNVRVASGSTGNAASVSLQSSGDENNWNWLGQTAHSPGVPLISASSVISQWFPLSSSATGDRVIRWVTISGSATNNAKIDGVTLHIR